MEKAAIVSLIEGVAKTLVFSTSGWCGLLELLGGNVIRDGHSTGRGLSFLHAFQPLLALGHRVTKFGGRQVLFLPLMLCAPSASCAPPHCNNLVRGAHYRAGLGRAVVRAGGLTIAYALGWAYVTTEALRVRGDLATFGREKGDAENAARFHI